jgi:hypothetical protein
MAAPDERSRCREVYLSVGWRRRGNGGARAVIAMVPEVEITPEHALHLVRSRMHPKIPLEDGGIQTPSATRIVEGFRARFDKACDASVWKRLSSAVLEPANRFDKARRQLRQEAIILGTLVLTALGLALYFNLNAIAR